MRNSFSRSSISEPDSESTLSGKIVCPNWNLSVMLSIIDCTTVIILMASIHTEVNSGRAFRPTANIRSRFLKTPTAIRQTNSKNGHLRAQMQLQRWDASIQTSSTKVYRTASEVQETINELIGKLKKNNIREEFVSLRAIAPTYKYTYEIKNQGNNSQLIQRLLQERGKWTSVNTNSRKQSDEVKFTWGYLPASKTSKMGREQMISRIPGSVELTDKGKLYENITQFISKWKLDEKFLPITFHFASCEPEHSLKRGLLDFIQFFTQISERTNLTNTWIFKPTSLNQGRQIHLFNSLSQLRHILHPISNRIPRSPSLPRDSTIPSEKIKKFPHFVKQKEGLGRTKSITQQKRGLRIVTDNRLLTRGDSKWEDLLQSLLHCVSNSYSIVLQKYIQNPLLIDNRKFDIRMWVLVDHYGNYFLYEEGYLRFSSEEYKLSEKTIDNNFVHLTNHCLQKHSQHYSKEANIRKMDTLKDHFTQRPHIYDEIINTIKRIIRISIQAAFTRIHREQIRCKCFQIFGYDFLIDREYNVKLIEANCNPAITEDSKTLKQLIPKMINDALRLTVDRQFSCQGARVKEDFTENLWIQLGQIRSTDMALIRK